MRLSFIPLVTELKFFHIGCVALRYGTARYRTVARAAVRYYAPPHVDARRRIRTVCALRYIAMPHGAVRCHAAQHGTASGVNEPLRLYFHLIEIRYVLSSHPLG